MFYEVLDKKQLVVLKKIARELPVKGSYLAGGTALALQLGHRKSEDLDWFSPNEFSIEKIITLLKNIGQYKEVEISKGTFHGLVDGVRVTWLYFPNKLLTEKVIDINFYNLPLAAPEDIGLMKLIAASQRGSKKDFIDLFALDLTGIKIEYLIKNLHVKYAKEDLNYYHIVKSLTYFDDAEEEVMPNMLWGYSWQEIKKYFLNRQKSFFDLLEKLG